MEDLIVILSAMGAIAFALGAVLIRPKRTRLAIPALLLGLVAVYELYMIRWGHTVVAPIRVDMLLEIPFTFVLWVWGILAFVLPSRSSKT